MHVICDRAALLDAINIVSGVVPSRTPRPQLTGLKLTARKSGDVGELLLAGTDGDIALALTLAQIDVKKEGEALVPADKIRQIVGAEDHEPTLTIQTDAETCVITGADATFKVYGFPPNDFPPIPDFNATAQHAKTTLTQDAGTLIELIDRTLFATARENSRYAINGVLLNRDGKKLEMVATDGRRLALAKANLKDAGEASSCIIPTKALNVLGKLLDEPDETVHAAITDNQAVFLIGARDTDGPGRATLSTNLVEGVFPPYEDVIPKDQDKKVTFDRDVLFSGVRRAALLTNEESRGVRLAFTGEGKQLELTSRAPEMGEANVQLDLADYHGDDIEIGFNPTFILDALKVIPDPEVIMELKAPNKPGLIKSGNDFMYVVMPVNLQ
ncbi:MAG: DNA polymerase III subunit beta [Planctomycetota bacterium]